MADQKISELTALTGANVADDDAIAIVDTSATETKKIVFSELKNALDTATGFVRITGDTMTGGLDVQSTITADGLTVDGDAKISSGSPTLRITETDTTDVNTRITAGGGNLYIQTENDAENSRTDRFRITHSTGDISFYDSAGSSQSFYWDASAESLGIGTTTAPSSNDVKQVMSSANGAFTQYSYNGGAGGVVGSADVGYLDFFTYTGNIGSETYSRRMTIDSSGNVGIGTSSPNNYSANHKSITLNAPTTPLIDLEVNGTRTGSFVATSTNVDLNAVTSVPIRFLTADTERMRIDSSGRVLLGTTTEGSVDADDFTISGDNRVGMTIRSANSGSSRIYFSDGTSGAAEYVGYITFDHLDNHMRFGTAAAERMRIDSSGNVGIGTSSIASGGAGTTNLNVHTPSATSTYFKLSNSSTGNSTSDGFDLIAASNGTAYVWNRENANMLFATNATERMRIDASGNVGIGQSPNMKLNILHADEDGIRLNTADGAASFIDFGDASDNDIGRISYDHADNHMAFRTNNTERMRIDSSGNVGIGVSNPSDYYSTKLVVDAEGGEDGITIASTTAAEAYLMFADGTSGDARYRGFVSYNHSFDSLRFATTGSEAMRIDSSGNLLVGHTAEGTWDANNSAILRASGVATFTSTSTPPLYANRLTSHGDIVQFRKDGAPVGSIGSASDYLYIYSPKATGGAGIGLGNSWIYPCNSTGSISDATFDLGISNARYKDLYLSGSIHGDVKFENNAGTTEYARFDGSGNLLVGTTSGNPTGNHEPGTLIFAGGQINVHRDNGNPLRVGNSVDGNLTEYYKQGVLVGNIGVSGNDFFVTGSASNIAGTYFANSKIMPMRSGATSDNTIDLGTSSKRFKNLHLSGSVQIYGSGEGIVFGTTATAAHTLDDYEEGEHTITVNQGGFSLNGSYTNWRYTKIGRMVHIEGLMLASSAGNDAAEVKINLPFAYLSRTSSQADLIVQTVATYRAPTGDAGLKGVITNSTSHLQFKKTRADNTWISLAGNEIASGDHIYVNLWYPTA